MKDNNKGFTLAELLIVVAVIAVLVAVAIPTFANQLEKSRQAVDVSNLRGAFAAARLAEMDGKIMEAGSAVKLEDATTGFKVFYYDPDDGKLQSTVINDAKKTARATATKIVADTSQLPAVCYYGAVKVELDWTDKANHTGLKTATPEEATAAFGAVITGKPYVAVFAEGKLVGVGIYDGTNALQVADKA